MLVSQRRVLGDVRKTGPTVTASTVRRTQQQLLYAAEQTIAQGSRFNSLDHVRSYVDELRDTWWWTTWCDDVLAVDVHRARSCTYSCARYQRTERAGLIQLCADNPTVQHLVHELAHVLAGATRDAKSHDPWFARVYYELTYLVRGCEPAQELAIAFDEFGVDYDAGGLNRNLEMFVCDTAYVQRRNVL